MALFRKFFFRKPPDGLLEISERVYVFDSCFTTDVLEEDEYKVYMEGIVAQLREHFPDSSFMVFNFREGENQSQISSILSKYDMIVMEYPRHYESCPILTMEMVHHFLRSSQSWLSLQEQHVLLMHCERGGWPVLAFMLAALLIYRKQYSGEQKTLDMIYKQAPRELLQLMSPLYPVPSQLRYLQYVSRRNCGSEWPPLDRALTLDCVILRAIPNFDGEGGCCPIFRIYGQDPFMAADRTPKILYSTPKRSKTVRRYKQADCGLVKIDINCHIQGDVVLECISLHNDLEHEHMMFRVMFNTAFLRSNILMLNRDEIDILWNAKDQFPKDFRAEVIFSEMDTARSLVMVDYSLTEGKEGLPVEAFAKVQEIFSNVDWLDPKSDVALDVLQKVTASNFILEKLDTEALSTAVCCADNEKVLAVSVEEIIKETTESEAFEESAVIPVSASHESQGETFNEPSVDADFSRNQIERQELQVAIQRSSPPKIISQQVYHLSRSNPVSCHNSLNGSPRPMSRYPSASSMLGITALLHDHATSKSEEDTSMASSSPSATTTSPISPLEPKAILDLNSALPSTSPQSLDESPIPMVQAPAPPPPKIPDHLQSEKPIGPDCHIEASLHFGSQSTCSALPPSHSSSSPSHSVKGLHLTENLAPIGAPWPSPPSIPSVTSSPISRLSSIPPTPPAPPPLIIGASIKRTPRFASSTSTAGLAQLTTSAVTIQPPSLPPPPPGTTSSIESTGLLQLNKSTIISGPPPPPPLAITSSTTTLGLSQLTQSRVTVGHPPPPPPPPLPGVTSSTRGVGLSQLTKSTVIIGPSPPSGTSSPTTSPSLPQLTKSIVIVTPPTPPSTGMTSSTIGPGLLQLKKSTITSGPPPPPGITSSTTSLGLSQLAKSTVSLGPSPPPPPPPPPAIPSATTCAGLSQLPKSSVTVGPPPRPPPSMHSWSCSADSAVSSTPPAPPPLPLSFSRKDPVSRTSLHIPLAPPPPPPLCSGPLSAKNDVSSVLPPPPPSSSAPKHPASGNPSQFPPVPPPPGPLAQGLSKASSGSLRSHAATSNGKIPPTPAPPLIGKSRIQACPLSRNQGQTKKSNLKPYHWLKLTRAMQGSLWAEAQKLDEASKAPEFDMKELESLFSAANPNSCSKISGKATLASAPKSEKIHLIEMRRAYNCEIMLSKVKVPLPDLMNSILALDDQALDIDQVDNLIKFCPTKEEMELLKGYKGENEKLGKCEQFFLELMKVPRVESKLRVFSFKIQFRSQVSDLRKSLSIVNSTAEETKNSVKLKRIMQTILSLGNALNHGTARGSAVGFRLDSLLKLTDTRARNNKMTLMHYLCKVLCEKLPELLDFPKDLVSLEVSAKIQLKYLAEEMQAISKGLEKVVQELTASENDGPVSDNFCKILKEFLGSAEAEVRSLASLYSSVGRNADALANYFGEDPAKCPFEQVVSTLLNFVRMFVRAHEDNCKQVELDKKKAEKEAESEKKKKEQEETENKTKIGALRKMDSRKESMQSPIWSATN